jgi:inosine-uridine nucleoside N-ribohydrolase
MSESRSPSPLLLDVDTGVDDALALALAINDAAADLVAVSTLAGNVDVQHTTRNTLTVLDWLGAHAVPVHRGASIPLVRDLISAPRVHSEDGLGNADLPRSERSTAEGYGPASIIRHAKERPGELSLICTGPLTNLAIALNVEPKLGEWLKQVVIMGGAYDVPGNTTPFAEFNSYCDPDAARRVFSAGLPAVTVVGLDVTHQTVLPRPLWESVRKLSSTTAVLVTQVCGATFTERGMDGFYLHDPLAVGVALDSSLVQCDVGRVEVDVDGDERGRTRLVPGGTTKVAKQVDAGRFLANFADALGLPLDRMLRPAANPA